MTVDIHADVDAMLKMIRIIWIINAISHVHVQMQAVARNMHAQNCAMKNVAHV